MYTESVLFSGLGNVYGVAVDGAGNVYLPEYNHGQVVKETLAPGGTYTQSTIGTGFSEPTGVAVDAVGNLYIADRGTSLLTKETISGGTYVQSTIGSGLAQDTGVAIDSAGNVYIADSSNGRVLKETLSGGGYTQSTVTSGLNQPYAVTVDASGTVYITDTANNRVLRETPATGGTYTQTILGSGLSEPFGLALDASGNVFIGSSAASVNKLDVADPQTLTFASTNVGSTSASQTVSLVNIGNAALVFPVPAMGTNPGISTGFVLGSGSTCPQLTTSSSNAGTLAAGAACTDVISFAPTVGGTASGQLVTTDSSLNASPSTAQLVKLTGPGVAVAPTVTGVSPAAGTSAGGTTVTITGTAFTGTTAVTFGNTAATSFTVVSATSITAIAPAGIAGALDLKVTTAGGTSAAVTADQFVYLGPPTIAVTSSAAIPGGTAILTATVSGVVTPTGGVNFTVNGGASVAGGCTAGTGLETCTASYSTTGLVLGSTYTITASFSADANYPATSNTGTLTVVPNNFTAATTPVGSTSSSGSATVIFTANTTLNANLGTAIQVVTQGITGLDFAFASGGSCTAGATYIAGQSCTVNYTFTPRVPGSRYGAVLLLNGASPAAVAASTFLQGVGTGPQANITPGIISTVAGVGPACVGTAVCGDGGQAKAANLAQPTGVILDAAGNSYIADTFAQRIRRVDARTGIITTIAGTGTIATYCNGKNGDGGVATSATLSYPQAVTLDGAGNLYVTDTSDQRIRKISTQTGIISTVAGGVVVGNTCAGSTGDNGSATSASLNVPDGVAIDGAGNLFIAELNGNRIRRIDAVTGIITTVAGNGTASSTGDNGPGSAATLNGPAQMAFDPSGNLFIAEYTGNRVRELLANGKITTIAGTGKASSTGDGGAAIAATVTHPNGVAVDAADDVYLAEEGNRIRKVAASTGVITTVAGTGTAGFTADGIGATQAGLSVPEGVALDGYGNLFIVDTNSNRIREVMMTTTGALAFGSAAVGSTSADSPRTVTVFNAGQTAFTITSGITSSSNQFQIGANSCTAGSTLAGGFACTAQVSFTPMTVGTQIGAVTAVDSTGVTHTFTVSGTGTPGILTATVANVSAAMPGSATLTASLLYGGATPTGAVTFTVGSSAAVPATCVAGSGSEVCTASYPTTGLVLGSNTIRVSIAMDNLYAAATATGTLTVVPGSYTATTTPVGTPSQIVTATLVIRSPVTLNPTLLSAIQVVTQGAPNLDFAYAPGGTCVAGTSFTAGQSCTVNVIFTPTAPGARLGAVLLYDNSPIPVLVSTAYLGGTGTSGLGLFEPATQITVASGLNTARGPSVDALGNLYVSEQGSGTIDKFAAGTGTKTVLVSGLSGPSGTTVDGAGNVYFGESNDGSGSGGVFELIGGTGTPVEIASGLSPDNVLLSDGTGNVYVTDYNTDAILQIAAGSHAVTTIFNGLGDRFIGLTLDASGNFYGATFHGNTMYELPAGNYNAPITLFSANGLSNPHGLVIDPAGNLYVTNYTGQANVIRYAAGTYASTTLAATGSRGIAMDGAGNLYTTDDGDLYAYNRGKAATLSFGSTAVGATSGDSPRSLLFENDGNVSLAVSAIGTSSSNFTLNKTATTCATGAFASAATCNLGVSFTPLIAGPLTGTLNITDNNLNLAGTMQTVALNGTATQNTPTVTVSAATVVYGTPTTTLSAAVVYPGSTAPSGAFTFTVGSGPAVVASCTGTSSPLICTAAYTTSALAVNSYQINGSLAADTHFATAAGTGTLTVAQASLTVRIANVKVAYGTATAPLSVSFTFPGDTAPTGGVTFTVDSGAAVTAVCVGTSSPRTCTASYATATLTAGAHTITASAAADATFNAFTGTSTLTVTSTAPTMTVAGQTIAYGTAVTTLSANVAFSGAVPTGAVSFTIDAGAAVTAICSGTASPRTCTASYPTATLAVGPHTVKASFAGDANYSASSGSGTVSVLSTTPVITVASVSDPYGAATATLSANVTFTGAVPASAVFFSVDNGTVLTATCTGTASPLSCTATYPVANLTSGVHTVTAKLAADSSYGAASGSGTLTLVVTNATISFAVASHGYGDPAFTVAATSNATGAFTYTVISGPATVSGSTVTLTGIGTVVLQASQAADANFVAGSRQASFTVAATMLTASASNASRLYGAANPAFTGTVTGAKYSDAFAETFTTTATASSPVGTYAIVPAVTGADLLDYTATMTNGSLTVTQAPTVASITNSAAMVNPNQAVTFNAAVASTTTGTPTGTVTFFDNGNAFSTVPLVNGGAAYTTTTLSPAATHSITVAYSGDTNFLPSMPAAGVPVTVGSLDFTFATVGYNAYTVAPGKVATFNFALAPEFTTYSGTVTFSVAGLPAGATASFSPASVAATGGAQAVVMTVQTPQATAENKSKPANPANPMQREWPVLALLLLPTLGSGRVRRKLSARMLMLALLVAGLGGATALTGCGTGNNGFLLQAPSTYTLTVTATSGTLQHSQTVTLTVQ